MAFYPDGATPLIIVGRQRAGTRFLTNALNGFEDVAIQSEVPTPVMRSAERMLRATEAYYKRTSVEGNARRLAEYRRWQTKRADLIFAIWANTSQGPRVEGLRNCRYYGYKRPAHEFFFDFYEQFLEDKKPFYIYCTRNFVDNYLSIASRWPDRPIEAVAEQYRESVKQFYRMRRVAGDRVLLFNLDEHKKVGMPYLERSIFHPLRLNMSDEHRKLLAKAAPVNATEGLEGATRRYELTAEEASFIESCPNLVRDFRRLTFLQSVPPSIDVK